MATHFSYNPRAMPFSPSHAVPPQWTPRNNPTTHIHCRFYLHELGNFCRFGNSCRYLHAQELYRPTVADQTTSLLQAVHQLILFAVTCLQHTHMAQPPTVAAEQRDQPANDDDLKLSDEDLSSIEEQSAQSKPTDALDAEPAQPNLAGHDEQTNALDQVLQDPDVLAGGKTFEDHIEANIDSQSNSNVLLDEVKQIFEDHDARHALDMDTDEKFDWVNPCDAKQHAAQLPTSQVDLFKFLWANSKDHLLQVLPTQVLPDTYPKQLLCSEKSNMMPFENATLRNLKTTKHNSKPIFIISYDADNQRYAVQIVDFSKNPKMNFKVKLQNIQLLKSKDVSEAYKDFEDHLRDLDTKRHKSMYSLLHHLHHPDEDSYVPILRFLEFQLAPVQHERGSTRREAPHIFHDDTWIELSYAVMDSCEMFELKLTPQGSQQIIALLYHVCYLQSFPFVWKRYSVPTTWTWKAWPEFIDRMTHSLSPPND